MRFKTFLLTFLSVAIAFPLGALIFGVLAQFVEFNGICGFWGASSSCGRIEFFLETVTSFPFGLFMSASELVDPTGIPQLRADAIFIWSSLLAGVVLSGSIAVLLLRITKDRNGQKTVK